MVTLLSYSISGICKLSLPFVTKDLQDYRLISLQRTLQLTSSLYRIKRKCQSTEGIEVKICIILLGDIFEGVVFFSLQVFLQQPTNQQIALE